MQDVFESNKHGSSSHTPSSTNTYGQIKDKVAVITDNKFTPQLIPLILHYHAVLGPSWPIVFYTSEEVIKNNISSSSPHVSGSWRSAVDDNRITVRTVPKNFALTSRHGVNEYLSSSWLWKSLAPAKHVLVFQADSMLCSNSAYRVEDFFQYDFIGAMVGHNLKLYNGGLSLRNRTMMLDIIKEGPWEAYYEKHKDRGEDIWFSEMMQKRGGNLPNEDIANTFALQYQWHINKDVKPLGYHKLRKNVPKKIEDIAKWCPENRLAEAGTLR
jgi:hypothetical protein